MGKFQVIQTALIILFLCFSGVSLAQHTLALDKKGKVKRIHFYAGDHIKIKLSNNEKLSGSIDAIYDSSFVIEGRAIELDEVAVVYTSRPVIKYVGGALVVAGVFYFGIDVINNSFNYGARGYIISDGVLLPVGISVGVGLVMMYFGTRRTQVYEQNNFRIFDTTPIPIKTEKEQDEK